MKIKNPKLTLTIGDGIIGEAYALDDNNELVAIKIDGNDTYETVALRSYGGEEYKFTGAVFYVDVEITDAINCTLTDGIVFITDPTKDASCTISAIPGIG